MELHVKGLGSFPAHVAGEDSVGGCVVSLDRGGRLRVAHLGEGSADGDGLLAVEEKCTGFCFRGRSYDSVDGLKLGEYWTISGQSWVNVVGWCIVAEVEVARGAAVCFRLDKIRGVAVDVETHVTSVELDDGVRLRGRVVHEHFHIFHGVSGGRGLFGAYVVERNKHREVNSLCDVEEGASNTLHVCDAAFIKGWCS